MTAKKPPKAAKLFDKLVKHPPKLFAGASREARNRAIDDLVRGADAGFERRLLNTMVKQNAEGRGGRPKVLAVTTQYIFNLVNAHPRDARERNYTARLHKIAATERPDDFATMPAKTFRNIVLRAPK